MCVRVVCLYKTYVWDGSAVAAQSYSDRMNGAWKWFLNPINPLNGKQQDGGGCELRCTLQCGASVGWPLSTAIEAVMAKVR